MAMLVSWQIEIADCDDPDRAAMIALDVIRSQDCGVQVFEVVELGDDGEALGQPVEVALETVPPSRPPRLHLVSRD